MAKKMYALIGNFGFGPEQKGLSVFSYDPETAAMEPVATVLEEVNVGHQSVDSERGIVYLVDERPSLRGQTGGGGYVMALKIEAETGDVSVINEQRTLSQEPCYTLLDATRRYLVVSHHADFGFVTKVVKGETGYSTEVVFDDTALVLFRINDDGSLGEACDVALTPGDGAQGPHPWSRQHSVVADPTGQLLVVCDKGLEQFHSYRLDRENGKLLWLGDTGVEKGLVPRYGAFHPSLPVFYANYEKTTVVHAYRCDVATGALDRVAEAPLFAEESADAPAAGGPTLKHPKTLEEVTQMEAVILAKSGRPNTPEPADLVIHPSGKCLYVSTRFKNTISVLDIDDTGAISLREVLDSGGVNPRGLHISADGRFLFAAHMQSGNVATFSIAADGSLRATGTGAKATSPGGIRIVEF